MTDQLDLFTLPELEESKREEKITKKIENVIPKEKLSFKYSSLEKAKSAALKCKECRLCEGRTNVVFSDGPENAKLMIIGEGPGATEDEQGLPFVGRAGKMLDKVFESVGLNRKEHLYICNIVKCRPPENRAPLPDEVIACRDYLEAQIKYQDPKIIILAGATAIRGILKIKQFAITKMRGEWIDINKIKELGEKEKSLLEGRKIMAIFHPSYLLRTDWNTAPGSPKALMWKDIQEIKRVFDSV
jgi:DNA polymerase